MSTPTFYHAGFTRADHQLVLSAEEARHASTVRRLSVGKPIQILNGQGLVAQAEIVEFSRHACRVKLLSVDTARQETADIIVATAIPKGDRQRYLVESLTQLGASRIVPLNCEYSAQKINAKSLAKWQRYAIEAIKQSQNPWLPAVDSLTCVSKLKELVATNGDCEYWLADEAGQRRIAPSSASQVLIAIGPEAGFTERELKFLTQQGFRGLALGPHILRTETAAITALNLLRSGMR